MREGKDMQIGLLLDFYEPILTDKQADFLRKYYDFDYSLSELAEEEGITRQAVQFALKKAEKKLFELEEKLKLRKRYEATSELIRNYEEGKALQESILGLRAAWED